MDSQENQVQRKQAITNDIPGLLTASEFIAAPCEEFQESQRGAGIAHFPVLINLSPYSSCAHFLRLSSLE